MLVFLLVCVLIVIICFYERKPTKKQVNTPSAVCNVPSINTSVARYPNALWRINWAAVLPESYVVIDLETTGLDPTNNEIVEIAAIKYDDHIQTQTFHSMVKPIIPITDQVSRINGITNHMLQNAPSLEMIMSEFFEFIGDYTLVAHNATFDIDFLQIRCLHQIQNEVVDTLKLSRTFINGVENYKLETLKNHLGITALSHRAADDCLVTAALYEHCFPIHQRKLKSLAKKREKIMQEREEQYCKEAVASVHQLTGEDRECLKALSAILEENDRNAKMLRVVTTDSHLSVYVFSIVYLNIKLSGKLTYCLISADEKTVEEAQANGLNIKPSSKTEGEGKYRLMFKSFSDIKQYEELLVKRFDYLVEHKPAYYFATDYT